MDFPLQLRFKVMALAPQVSVTDARGQLMLYVKQKLLKLKESVTVFADEAQTRPLFHINADRVIDISARYNITSADGQALGQISQKGLRSLWRAHFEITRDGQPVFVIREANPWVKVIDGLFGDIPVLGLLSGYVFHPAYVVSRQEGGPEVLRVTKQPAFLEGRYAMTKSAELARQDEGLAVLSILMMVLLERRRG